ncbi:hypothetical protein [Alkalimarinus alittae]|uniref:Uncharacterized protein n=1 Tax=Alkalimarinus alittae TaxID=2961619 RepID=A0ABY6N5S4_9ALTE|nr:hypothetical protein [Alkalimarinus alittae]UZE97473.1 hypothetical protein NKI27_06940 [Alkalimarinus alittae]
MPQSKVKSQQLHASNVSSRIGEALEARVKDPLWFLARQWQTGEFSAENGGRPAQIAVDSKIYPFQSVNVGNKNKPIKPDVPLESVVEAETDSGDAPAWQSEALEYRFKLKSLKHHFTVSEYDGRFLDWSHFSYSGPASGATPSEVSQRVTPTQLYFQGAPHPRWWRLEEGDVYFDSPKDPEQNALSLLLPEFFYTDINNWYTLPLSMPSGSLREITDVTVIDSFGVITSLNPVVDSNEEADWALFAQDHEDADLGESLNGRYLLAPNTAIDIVQNDEIEEVRFIRDEDANLVWAWERRMVNEQGQTETTVSEQVGGGDMHRSIDGLPQFKLKSATARHWIPYVPRHNSERPEADGAFHLRRARTDEQASQSNPQYRTQIVKESKRIFEEEITPTGIRVRRIARFSRGSDGKAYFWIGRDKEVAQRTARPGLSFDYISDNDT